MANSRPSGLVATFDFRLEPIARPKGFPPIEECDRKFNLRFEIAVKASLSATRLGEDRVDSNLVDPLV
jgi:hypothetical protein